MSNQPRTDCRTADAATIRRAVAERLGYTVWYSLPADDEIFGNSVLRFQGKAIDSAAVTKNAPDELWNPFLCDTSALPDYPNDVAAALALPLCNEHIWLISQIDRTLQKTFPELDIPDSANWSVSIGLPTGLAWIGHDPIYHASLAMAICIAWLEYKGNS